MENKVSSIPSTADEDEAKVGEMGISCLEFINVTDKSLVSGDTVVGSSSSNGGNIIAGDEETLLIP